jgi:hypothetical protein
VELNHGEKLPHVDGFPYLICRPCERRLNNTISFKNVISATQKSLVKDSRFKRCPEVSPSVAKLSAKVSTVVSRSRSSKSQSGQIWHTFTHANSTVAHIRNAQQYFNMRFKVS